MLPTVLVIRSPIREDVPVRFLEKARTVLGCGGGLVSTLVC